jgi:hypothetical protein
VALRAGAAAKYLKEKGHSLFILDDDSVDESGKPSPVLEKWRPVFKDIVLPALIVSNKDAVLKVMPCPANPDDVLLEIKKTGG